MTTAPPVTASSFTIGGDLPVRRLGYGTMQLTGPGHWDLPHDPENAIAVLRTAVHEHGITHLDTADAYGPHTVENLIRRALHPYPAEVVIATKGGLTRPGPNVWRPCGRPEYLQQCVELSLRRLGVDCLDLYYLHRIDPQVPSPTNSASWPSYARPAKLGTSACPKSRSTRYSKPARSPTSPPCKTSTG
jgi:pyridoxine 4-dehydrogenase